MKTCQNYDYTNCSITEGYSKLYKVYIIILTIIFFVIIYQLIKQKYFTFLGLLLFSIILLLIIDHQTDIFSLPRWKRPKKIKTKYKHLLDSNINIKDNRNL